MLGDNVTEGYLIVVYSSGDQLSFAVVIPASTISPTTIKIWS